MTVVVDTSALIAVLLGEPSRTVLIERTQGADLLAPGSVHWEVGNAFSALLKRRRLTPSQITEALHAYALIPIRLVDVDLVTALAFADRFGLYAYDAYLLACAQTYGAPLLTLDDGLRRAAQGAGLRLVEV